MIADKIAQINTLKNQVDTLSPRKEWDNAFFDKVKIDFTYNSNKIEGNTLTYGQTIKLLKEFVTPQNAAQGEVLDIVNHHNVLNNIFATYQSQEISEENIKSLHKELMKNISQWNDDGLYSPGQYKSFENMTMRSGGKIHHYLLPEQVEAAMAALISDTNSAIQFAEPDNVKKHPLTIATRFHQRFLNIIHPFSDGNGRIGRIFTNLILLKQGYPPIFIETIDRNDYLKRFEMSDIDIDPMLDFMADRLIESLHAKLIFVQRIEKV